MNAALALAMARLAGWEEWKGRDWDAIRRDGNENWHFVQEDGITANFCPWVRDTDCNALAEALIRSGHISGVETYLNADGYCCTVYPTPMGFGGRHRTSKSLAGAVFPALVAATGVGA